MPMLVQTHCRWRDAARSEGVARTRADADARLKAVTAEIVSRYEARLSALTADVAAAQVYTHTQFTYTNIYVYIQ
jgi:hypothetical protein